MPGLQGGRRAEDHTRMPLRSRPTDPKILSQELLNQQKERIKKLQAAMKANNFNDYESRFDPLVNNVKPSFLKSSQAINAHAVGNPAVDSGSLHSPDPSEKLGSLGSQLGHQPVRKEQFNKSNLLHLSEHVPGQQRAPLNYANDPLLNQNLTPKSLNAAPKKPLFQSPAPSQKAFVPSSALPHKQYDVHNR